MVLAGRAGNKVRVFLEMIRFEHTLFALPFAYQGLWLAENGRPRIAVFLWVTAAMAGMRTAAMAINRLADRKIDSLNPRTKHWALPQGLLTPASVTAAAAAALSVYFFAAAKLNPLCLALSPIPLVMVTVYPYLKRFTWFCHFFLGMILGLAPAAGWIASRGSVSAECWILFAAVFCWVAGFDIIYALQDVSFDREFGLKSFPASFGGPAALWLTRALHVITVVFLAVLGRQMNLGVFYWSGLLLIAGFLAREHWLVAKSGLEKIQEAFFLMNVLVSGILFFATWMDLLL